MNSNNSYADKLAQKIDGRRNLQVSIKLRALLKGFGYYRRTSNVVEQIHCLLKKSGLVSEFSLDHPADLDDKVIVKRIAPDSGLSNQSQNIQAGTPSPKPPETPVPIENAVQATVEIITDTGRGSGFIIDSSGLVVTGRHVVNDENGYSLRSVQVCLFPESAGECTMEGIVFRSHPKLDFAFVWLDAKESLPVLPIGNPGKLRHADTVYAVGAPIGMPNTVSRGIISNPKAHFRGIECLQTDAAVDHGNSGGPLINSRGEVIGIVLWGIGQSDALKLTLPVDYLTDEIEFVLRTGRDKCLAGVYCPACGYLDLQEPVWYCRNCGVNLKALKQEDEEIEKCLRAVKLNPTDAEAYCTLGNALLDRGRYDEAIEKYKKALELNPSKADAYYYWGIALSNMKHYDEAIEKFKKATEIKPDYAGAYYKWGCVLSQQKHFDDAIEKFQKAVELNPNNLELWYTLGRFLSRQGDFEKALTAFLKAYEIAPNDPDVLYNIGDALLGLGQPAKAVDPLLAAVRLKPDYSLAHYDLSLAFFELKQYSEAETAAREVLRDDPDMEFQWSNIGMGATENLGIALMNQGRMEEAEACFRRNIGLLTPTFFNLGLTLFRMQRYDEALENFQRAVELKPDDPEYHNLLGQTYDQLGQPVDAEKELRRAVELNDQYAMGYYDLGVILAKREGRQQEALESFEQALKNDPDMAPAYYCIACLYALSKNEDQALNFLEQAFLKDINEIPTFKGWIEKDSDWDGLRTNPEFISLLEKYRDIEKAGDMSSSSTENDKRGPNE